MNLKELCKICYNIISFEEDGMVSWRTHGIQLEKHINVFKVIEEHNVPFSPDYLYYEIYNEMQKENVSKSELKEIIENIKTKYRIGTHSTIYVTIKSRLS